MAYSVVATAEVANGRVKLDASGGVPGLPLYLFRRDNAGVAVVRDTSGGTVAWPSNTLADGGAASTGGNWTYATGTGGTNNATLVSPTDGSGPEGRNTPYVRRTLTAAKTAGSSGYTYTAPATTGGVSGVAGDVRTLVAWVRSSVAATYTPTARLRSGTTTVTTQAGPAVAVPANTWTRMAVTVTATGTFNGAQLDVLTGNTLALGVTQDATEAAALVGTGVVTVYDNEARQGLQTDYLLADQDGQVQATVRIDLPLWGTWLKSPGRPYLNTRCVFGAEGKVKRASRRLAIPIEGAARPLVISQVRGDVQGSLVLAALDVTQVLAVERLLDDGDTLMLDTNPAWGVSYRYISVGDTERDRALSDGVLGLDRTERTWTFNDVLAVDAPVGVTAVDPGRTYATLPTLYGNYAALAAINGTYTALALGTDD